MAETPDQIKQHIEERRGRITEDINELEYRVKRTVDWRAQFNRYTAPIMGAAFAAGAALGFVTAKPRRNEHEEEDGAEVRLRAAEALKRAARSRSAEPFASYARRRWFR